MLGPHLARSAYCIHPLRLIDGISAILVQPIQGLNSSENRIVVKIYILGEERFWQYKDLYCILLNKLSLYDQLN